MSGDPQYSEQLRQKVLSGIDWRDTREARRHIFQWMRDSQSVLPTPEPAIFDERERILSESGRSLARTKWDRAVFAIRDLIADGKTPHMGRMTRWSIHAVMVACSRIKQEVPPCQTN